MYLFKTYNKLFDIDVDYNNLITDHPIDNVYGVGLYMSIVLNKKLLQRDLYYDEYIKLFNDKLVTNAEAMQLFDINIITNFLGDNFDCDTLSILINLITRCKFNKNSRAILDTLKLDYYLTKIIELGNTEIILSIIKIASRSYDYHVFDTYIKHIDINAIEIESLLNYAPKKDFYDFFDKLSDSDIYCINIDKLFNCCTKITKNESKYRLELFVYFIKKYYSLDNIMDITGVDHTDLPIEKLHMVIRRQITLLMCDYESNSVTNCVEFIGYIEPNIFTTDSYELSHFYTKICRFFKKNTCEQLSHIRDKIETSIKFGSIDRHKIIDDIVRYQRQEFCVDDLSVVLDRLRTICEVQYLSIDNFDSLFMTHIDDNFYGSSATKNNVLYFCDIINEFFPPEYSDQYINHYYSYILSYAIDHIRIDDNYIILEECNISLHISNFAFYPYYALLNTSNPVLIDYIIDNYAFNDESLIQLVNYYDNYTYSPSDCQPSYLYVKLGKKYESLLKRRQYHIITEDNVYKCINYKIIDNICSVDIEQN
jgi:hypothetical protein